MRKLLTSTVALAAAIAFAPVSIAQAGDGPKVTGGGNAIAGGIVISVSANASETKKGVNGNIQYNRNAQGLVAELKVHARVECFGVAADGSQAAVAGPARAQKDPAGIVQPDDYLLVNIKEGGTGSGDLVRVRVVSAAVAEDECANPDANNPFPGFVQGGNFTLRP